MENEVIRSVVPGIWLTLVQQLNCEAREKEILLQTEENGNKIAKLQGFLAGVIEYKEVMIESGYMLDEKYLGTQECKTPYIQDGELIGSFAELRDVVSDINDFTETYTYSDFINKLNRRIEEKKNDLYYSSDKGRDLYFVKGWHNGITRIGRTMDDLLDILDETEKEKEEMLPFDDEE